MIHFISSSQNRKIMLDWGRFLAVAISEIQPPCCPKGGRINESLLYYTQVFWTLDHLVLRNRNATVSTNEQCFFIVN